MRGSRSPITAGRPGLKMPAFSPAIDASVEPRYSMWSSPMDVTPATIGSSTFVESRRPPRPASITATSAPARAKWSNAIAVVASKKLAPISSMSGMCVAMNDDDVVGRDHLTADDHPFAKVHQMRRRVRRHTESFRREESGHRRDAASLPVRAGDVDRRIASLRIAERGEQRRRALESELERAGRPREQEGERVAVVGELRSGGRRGQRRAQGDVHPVAAGRPDMWRSSWLTVRLRFRRCVTLSSMP